MWGSWQVLGSSLAAAATGSGCTAKQPQQRSAQPTSRRSARTQPKGSVAASLGSLGCDHQHTQPSMSIIGMRRAGPRCVRLACPANQPSMLHLGAVCPLLQARNYVSRKEQERKRRELFDDALSKFNKNDIEVRGFVWSRV